MGNSASRLYKLVIASLFCTLTCVATLIHIPLPSFTGGYLNFGDCFVLLCGWLLGPVYGFLSAAVGSGLSDIISGYAIYAPASFIIKGITALCAYGVFRFALNKQGVARFVMRIVSAVCAETVMIVGYFLYAATVMGYGIYGAAADLLLNLIQSIVGIVSGVMLIMMICRSGLEKQTNFKG